MTLLQSEVSQKEKNKYHILIHIYAIYTVLVLLNLSAGQEQRCRHREWTCENNGEREGGMN